MGQYSLKYKRIAKYLSDKENLTKAEAYAVATQIVRNEILVDGLKEIARKIY